jgi:hypothetical protein
MLLGDQDVAYQSGGDLASATAFVAVVTEVSGFEVADVRACQVEGNE